MSIHLYPVPGAENNLEPMVEPFLESTVSEEALSPDTQFLILVFGESASERIPEVKQSIKGHSPESEQALEIGQMSVDSIDERRLNTFITSLFFNLLEVDSSVDLEEVLQSDVLKDEDERKVDYYLPRVIDSVKEKTDRQAEEFKAKLEETFSVDLQTDQARAMHERLEMDIVTAQTIIDYLLLAASSTEDPEGIRKLVQYLRENDIDSSGYLSGGSDDIAGYQRVFSLSYHLTSDDFRDEFKTARKLYSDGANSELFRILNEVDTEIQLAEIYNHESPIERLITSQFAGNDREIAQRLLRTINGTRAVENNRDEVENQFEDRKQELEETIEQVREEVRQLDGHNTRFEETKIQIESSEIERFSGFVDRVEEIDSSIAKYLLGYSREKRTSVFETLSTRIKDYQEELKSYRKSIDGHIDTIDGFEQKKSAYLDTVQMSVEQTRESSVEVGLPAEEAIKRALEAEWDRQVEQLEESLSPVDLDAPEDDIRDHLDEWEESIERTREDLDEIARPVDRLEEFSNRIADIEEERNHVRSTLEDIQELMEARS